MEVIIYIIVVHLNFALIGLILFAEKKDFYGLLHSFGINAT